MAESQGDEHLSFFTMRISVRSDRSSGCFLLIIIIDIIHLMEDTNFCRDKKS